MVPSIVMYHNNSVIFFTHSWILKKFYFYQFHITSDICFHSLSDKTSIWPIDKTFQEITLESRGTWDQWHWRSTQNSPELKNWNLIIIWFNSISRTFIGEVLPIWKDVVSVFYSPNWLGWCVYMCFKSDQMISQIVNLCACIFVNVCLLVCIYVCVCMCVCMYVFQPD